MQWDAWGPVQVLGSYMAVACRARFCSSAPALPLQNLLPDERFGLQPNQLHALQAAYSSWHSTSLPAAVLAQGLCMRPPCQWAVWCARLQTSTKCARSAPGSGRLVWVCWWAATTRPGRTCTTPAPLATTMSTRPWPLEHAHRCVYGVEQQLKSWVLLLSEQLCTCKPHSHALKAAGKAVGVSCALVRTSPPPTSFFAALDVCWGLDYTEKMLGSSRGQASGLSMAWAVLCPTGC